MVVICLALNSTKFYAQNESNDNTIKNIIKVATEVRFKNIENSGLTEVVVTDTIPLRQEALDCKKIRQLSVAEMLGETIRRIANRESVSSMYID